MNIMVTLQRKDDGLPPRPMIGKIYDERFHGVERLEWQPKHIVFHFKNDAFIAVRADRVLEMITYED
jgi:hypothetical protein